jgi:1-pyrroline-5-carboxylate dehydrogenase
VWAYAPGGKERAAVDAAAKEYRSRPHDIPMIIGGKPVHSDKKVRMAPPYDHTKTLGTFSRSGKEHVQMAVQAALAAKPAWEAMGWEHRASIFLKAADLMAGPWRARMNAATMVCQAKTVHQSEIDAVCELIDFLRFNAHYMKMIYEQQPDSQPGMWNRMEYRPLEGFVFALTPFNFTSIAGNLPSSPALMGNTVVWKPADSQVFSAYVIMQVFMEAGLPPGVINLVYPSGREAGEVLFAHPDFAGIHFTGSTEVFQQIWLSIAQNLPKYKSYPRIVGETGGKDFVVIHGSADALAAATALTRGAFEFQGQKCSAASRAYIAASVYNHVMDRLVADLKSIKMGSPEDPANFFSAVIDEKAFDKIAAYIDGCKKNPACKIVAGGNYDKSKGYFIEPTVVVTTDPKSTTMCEEIFGPVLTVYKFDDKDWDATLQLVDATGPYALTGAVFAQDRAVIVQAAHALRNAAGNFYINDKPTGAVVNQQPFGGARASGTNDKAGSYLNLLRWVSARTIKETFVPPTDYRYPFLG